MGKIRKFLVVPVLATLMVGCASNTKQLGTIGNVTFYRVKSRDFAGPNITTLVAEKDGQVAVVETFGGPGLGASTISAIGQVGGSAVLGLSFPKIPKNVGDNINVSGGNSNGGTINSSSSSSATGGNANATGGNGNGGNGGTANGGGQFVPPGHINNPGGNPNNP